MLNIDLFRVHNGNGVMEVATGSKPFKPGNVNLRPCNQSKMHVFMLITVDESLKPS